MNDEDFTRSEALGERWAHLSHACGGEQGYGVYPFDLATLFFDRSRWDLAGEMRSGCMEKVRGAQDANYRSFLVQGFKRKGGDETLLVAVTHNPHGAEYRAEIVPLRSAVDDLLTRTSASKVLLVADTNFNGPGVILGRSSEALMRSIHPNADSMVATSLHSTCCAWLYAFAYDRIIAAGFPEATLETHLPFGTGHPPFAARNMHDPIVARITYARAAAPAGGGGSRSGAV